MASKNISEKNLDEILNRDFTNIFRSGYIKVKGVTLSQTFEGSQEKIYEWNVRDEDVWICSFPKTGTTWTQEMVWMIMHNLDFVGGKLDLAHRSPFLEVSVMFDFKNLKKHIPELQYPQYLDDSFSFIETESQKGPLCIKTHLPWILLPKEIQENVKRPKMIYITRNPKDTCVSYFYHSQLVGGYRGNFEDFCELFLAGKLEFAPYCNHILSFWERRNQPNILFLKYEELIEDLPAIIRKVSNFLEKPLTDDQIHILSNHLSFENMKKNPAVNHESVIELNRKYKLNSAEGRFMRSGKVGDYKSTMSKEIIEKFDDWYDGNMKNTGLIF